jgi:hypothetical protein
MRAPRHHRENAPIGPLLNAFFGWGVLPGTEVKIGKIAQVAGSDYDEALPATFAVELNHHDAPHKVLVRVIRERGNWRVANISYDSGSSLADYYRDIRRR